ncbi:MAG: heme-binding protein, partial [Parvularculaceae bacterium]|nr:heme-binding protein [Parvularculaceae bacterium]
RFGLPILLPPIAGRLLFTKGMSRAWREAKRSARPLHSDILTFLPGVWTMRSVSLLCVVSALLPLPALAAEVMAESAALAIVEGCAAHARVKDQSHAIAVYDAAGSPVAVLRMDGNTPGVVSFAMEKALAVANWRFSTSEMEQAVKGTPGFADAPNIVTVPGGVPVYSSETHAFIGSVGVSGEAPQDDELCAQAGIQNAGMEFERTRD